MQKEQSKKFNSFSEWAKAFPIAYAAALKQGLIPKLLEDFGWEKKIYIAKDNYWDKVYNLVKKHIEEYNKIPKASQKIENINLGTWCNTQKEKYKKKLLKKSQIESLESLNGWMWNVDDVWDKNFKLLLKYIKKHNKLPSKSFPKKSSKTSWCAVQRLNYKKNKLSKKRIKKLESIKLWKWTFDKKNDFSKKWDEDFELLKKYVSTYNKMPITNEVFENIKIDSWIKRQRLNYGKNILSQEKIKKLESIKLWKWTFDKKNHFSKKWDEDFELLKEYVSLYNKLPIGTEIFKKNNIGFWRNTQRMNYRKNILSQEKIKKLESIKLWVWNTIDLKWDEHFELLKEYISSYNKLPKRAEIFKKKNLASWCDTQKVNYKKNILSKERIKKLKSIKLWAWDTLDVKWSKNFKLLKEYISSHNKLPKKAEIFKKNNIASWCNQQRANYKKNTLSKERIKKLESIKYWKWVFK